MLQYDLKKTMESFTTAPVEGEVTKEIENVTSKIPSDIFLWTAVGIMGVSFALQVMKSKHKSLFFGQWVAPFLLFGIYNKMVKQLGHDQLNPTAGEE